MSKTKYSALKELKVFLFILQMLEDKFRTGQNLEKQKEVERIDLANLMPIIVTGQKEKNSYQVFVNLIINLCYNV